MAKKYVIDNTTKLVSIWEDNPRNNQRLLSGNWGVAEHIGDVEIGSDGLLYAKGYAPKKSLLVLKQEALATVQVNKTMAKDSGFIVQIDNNDVLFDSDANAQTAYLMFATALAENPSYSIEWKASAGVWVTMDAILFAKASDSLSAHFSACFAWQKAKEDQINACLTEDELNAISLVYGQ